MRKLMSKMVIAFVLGAIVIESSAGTDAAQPTNKCQSPNLNYGFFRNAPDARNWCTNDGAATEWMQWNNLPGMAGFNDPFGGPYASQMFGSMASWASRDSKHQLVFSSGYWIDNVDTFVWAQEFDFVHPGFYGWVDNYWCTSQTSCTMRTITDTNGIGYYNLSYVYFDDDGLPYGNGIVGHELGHAMGLVHGNNVYQCPPQARIMNYGCVTGGTTAPTSYDGSDLYGMYLP